MTGSRLKGESALDTAKYSLTNTCLHYSATLWRYNGSSVAQTSGMEIMETREPEKRNFISEHSQPRNSSEKSTEKSSESSPAQTAERHADSNTDNSLQREILRKVKFEVYGEEMISKEVKQSGNSGRVYLPPDWIGKNLKIIRVD